LAMNYIFFTSSILVPLTSVRAAGSRYYPNPHVKYI